MIDWKPLMIFFLSFLFFSLSLFFLFKMYKRSIRSILLRSSIFFLLEVINYFFFFEKWNSKRLWWRQVYTNGQDCVQILYFLSSPRGKKTNRKKYDIIILCRRGDATEWHSCTYLAFTEKRWVSYRENPFQNPTSVRILPDLLQKVPLHSTILSTMLSAKWKCSFSFLFFLKVLYFNESNLSVK